jgi:hypothetical protein
LSLSDSFSLIQQDPKAGLLSDNIQAALGKRCNFERLKKQIHKAKVIIPHLAAHILTLYPALISPAVEAFYTRDPVSTKPIAKMEKFSPTSNLTMTASFTKIRYSQLKCANFVAPAVFNLPPVHDPGYQAAELGMKLTCGFEILFNSLRNDAKVSDTYTSMPDIIDLRLIESGYYQPQIVGSNLSLRLKATALQAVLSQSAKTPVPYLLSEFKRLCNEEELMDHSFFSQASPDSDSWMMIDVKEVDALLDEKVKKLEFSSDSDFLVCSFF